MSFNAAVIYWVTDTEDIWVTAGSTSESRRAAENFVRSHGHTVTGLYKVPTGMSGADIMKANKPGVLFR